MTPKPMMAETSIKNTPNLAPKRRISYLSVLFIYIICEICSSKLEINKLLTNIIKRVIEDCSEQHQIDSPADCRRTEQPIVRELKHMHLVALQILHNDQQQDSNKRRDTAKARMEIIKCREEHT